MFKYNEHATADATKNFLKRISLKLYYTCDEHFSVICNVYIWVCMYIKIGYVKIIFTTMFGIYCCFNIHKCKLRTLKQQQ